jgi:hypothetical protein
MYKLIYYEKIGKTLFFPQEAPPRYLSARTGKLKSFTKQCNQQICPPPPRFVSALIRRLLVREDTNQGGGHEPWRREIAQMGQF